MISIGSDQLVNLIGLYDNVSDSYQNSATVNGALLDSTGASITTFGLSYVSSSYGNYRGTISATTTATLTNGASYNIKVTVTNSGNTLIVYLVDYAGFSIG